MPNLSFISTTNITESETTITAGTVVVAFCLLTCAVFTVVGNTLVIIAVSKMRYLRSMTNYFIVSLAVADLLMGSVVMPFGVYNEMYTYWPFGEAWCDLWRAFDVLSSTASILNLEMIALERYWATKDPITYPTKMTHRRCLMMVGLVWVCSSAISFPAIIWWRAVRPEPVATDLPKCLFTDDRWYILLSATISFYMPLIIMVMVYWRIYRTATNLIRSMNTGAKMVHTNGNKSELMVLRIHRGGGGTVTASGTDHAVSKDNPYAEKSVDSNSTSCFAKLCDSALAKRLRRFSNEQKAAKTLGIVMGVFIICWLPFFVCLIIVAIDKDALGPKAPLISSVVTWLGYMNSLINPIIYVNSMRDFRRAFNKLLCQCFPCYNESLRELIGSSRNNRPTYLTQAIGQKSTIHYNAASIHDSDHMTKSSKQKALRQSSQLSTTSDTSPPSSPNRFSFNLKPLREKELSLCSPHINLDD